MERRIGNAGPVILKRGRLFLDHGFADLALEPALAEVNDLSGDDSQGLPPAGPAQLIHDHGEGLIPFDQWSRLLIHSGVDGELFPHPFLVLLPGGPGVHRPGSLVANDPVDRFDKAVAGRAEMLDAVSTA